PPSPLSLYPSRPPRAPPSFPTRRSSDLPSPPPKPAADRRPTHPTPLTGGSLAPPPRSPLRDRQPPGETMFAPDRRPGRTTDRNRSEEHTSELQSLTNLVCRLLLEKKKQR